MKEEQIEVETLVKSKSTVRTFSFKSIFLLLLVFIQESFYILFFPFVYCA